MQKILLWPNICPTQKQELSWKVCLGKDLCMQKGLHIGQPVSTSFYLLKQLFLPFCEFKYEWYMFSKLRPNRTKQSRCDFFFFLFFLGNLLSAWSFLSQFSLTSGAVHQI